MSEKFRCRDLHDWLEGILIRACTKQVLSKEIPMIEGGGLDLVVTANGVEIPFAETFRAWHEWFMSTEEARIEEAAKRLVDEKYDAVFMEVDELFTAFKDNLKSKLTKE